MTAYTPERKDTMLRMAVELAAEYDLSGVEMLHEIVAEVEGTTSSKTHATNLFYEYFDRDIEIGDYAEFAKLVRSLIEYAGEWDEDFYND